MLLGKPAEQDGKGEGHDLGHQQRQQQAGTVQTQRRTVGSCHIDDGVHAVDVEEEGQQEQEGFLFLPGVFQGVPQPGKGGGDGARLAGHAVLLPIGLHQRQGHSHPPESGDAEGDQHGGGHAQTQSVGEQHRHQTGHKGQTGADIAPCVTKGGDVVHPVGLGHVGQHGIVEDQTSRIAHLGDDEQDEEDQPLPGQTQADAAHGANGQKGQKDGLFIALVVGHGAEHRPQKRHQQGGHRGGVAPIGQIIHVGQAGGGGQMVEINGHDSGNQQGKSRVAHIVQDPVLFLFGQFEFHNDPSFVVFNQLIIYDFLRIGYP